jgi:hypothetical protein
MQVKELQRQIEPLQNRVATLEAGMDLLRDELSRTREIAGLPTLESETAKIEIRFSEGLAKLRAGVAPSSPDPMQLDQLSDQLDQRGLTIPQLLEVGKDLKEMEEQFKGLRDKSMRELRYRRNQARKALEWTSKDMPQFAPWLAEVRANLENEAANTQELLRGSITLLQNRRARLAEQCATRIVDLSTELGTAAGEQA